MGGHLGVSYAMFRRCSRCSTMHPTVLEAEVCCLHAPKFTGWCAWCGDDIVQGKRLTFCSIPCRNSFKNDVLDAKRAGRK